MLQFDVFPSPLGPILVAVTRRGVIRIAFAEEDVGATLAALENVLAIPADRAELTEERGQLREYFAGTRTAFTLPVDFELVPTPFARRVLEATARIPYGETATYSDVAEMAGRPRAARSTGNALRQNPVPLLVPCHRVVPASGGIGGYSGDEHRKAWLLNHETNRDRPPRKDSGARSSRRSRDRD